MNFEIKTIKGKENCSQRFEVTFSQMADVKWLKNVLQLGIKTAAHRLTRYGFRPCPKCGCEEVDLLIGGSFPYQCKKCKTPRKKSASLEKEAIARAEHGVFS